jgi:hypothetical protein
MDEILFAIIDFPSSGGPMQRTLGPIPKVNGKTVD